MTWKLCMAAAALGASIVSPGFADPAMVKARMKSIVFEELDFRSIAFTDAVAFLKQEARARDPKKKGINLILKTEGGANPTLSLMLGKASLYEVLKLITETADYRWCFIGDNLILEPNPQEETNP